jgi:hypothetical protein
MNVMTKQGDSLALLKALPSDSLDSIVTDPPYELGFMGRAWDKSGIAYNVELWKECLRVAKPGAHLLAFGGTRTSHRMVCAIEDAGWEIRDSLGWMYGSGFPKSLNISKALDRAAGETQPVVGDKLDQPGYHLHGHVGGTAFGHGLSSTTPETRLKTAQITAPVTDMAKTWAGWGTALKPAWEPIVLARKPLMGTVAENVEQYATGALNIDGCRIRAGAEHTTGGRWPANLMWTHHDECRPIGRKQVKGKQVAAGCTGFGANRDDHYVLGTGAVREEDEWVDVWDCHPDCPSHLFPETGASAGGGMKDLSHGRLFMGETNPNVTDATGYGDNGSAARFFYCAKVSRREREAGCEDLPAHTADTVVGRDVNSAGVRSPRAGAGRGAGTPLLRCTRCGADGGGGRFATMCDDGDAHDWVEVGRGAPLHNTHPTVKPLALMRYLVRLVTPPQGIVLDPFMGSGTTGCACAREGRDFIGFDLSDESVAIANARIAYWQTHDEDFAPVPSKILDDRRTPMLELD